MKNVVKFKKKDNIKIDTIFCLLPIFTVQKTYKRVVIENKKINGFTFSYHGFNMDMNQDFKLFCMLIRDNVVSFEGKIQELMSEFGIESKRINKDTKESFFESLMRLRRADFEYESKRRKGGFSIIYHCDWDKETDKIIVQVNKELIDLINREGNEYFLNYEDLDKKFGKKLIEKKLFLYFNSFKNNTEMNFKWDNIFANLGIENPKPHNKIAVKKSIFNLIQQDIITGYQDKDKDTILIKLRRGSVKKSVVQEKKKFENDIPF